MKLQIISDIHGEKYGGARQIADLFDPQDIDVLILAGDIGSLYTDGDIRRRLDDLLRMLASKYPDVIYVPGNHDFWGSSITEGLDILREMTSKYPNVHFLFNQHTIIKGQRFLGGTMFFPIPNDPLWCMYSRDWNDFDEIKGFRDEFFHANSDFRDFYEATIKQDDIVVTHYLPSHRSIDPRFIGNPTNCFYLSEMQPYFEHGLHPRLWIHGHTHFPQDYQHGPIHVICNPLGYPRDINFNKERTRSILNCKKIEV